MSQKEQYYDLQPSFNSGEISPDVANRTDLDKYKSALLTARNAYVRPYGAVYRRPGTQFIAETKYADKKCILYEFDYNAKESYLLEIGEKYIRVYRDGTYLGVEVATPFLETELTSLRFAQSADTLFIASGTHNVQLFQRYRDTDWRLSGMDLTNPYFDLANGAGGLQGVPTVNTGVEVNQTFSTAGSFTFTAPADGDYTITLTGGGGGGIYYLDRHARKRSLGVAAANNDGSAGDYYIMCPGGRGEKITVTMHLTGGQVYSGSIGNVPANSFNYSTGQIATYPGGETLTTGNGGAATFNGRTANGGGGAVLAIIFENAEYEMKRSVTAYSENTGNGQGNAGGYYSGVSNDGATTEILAIGPSVNIAINTNHSSGESFATTGIQPSSVTGNVILTCTDNAFVAGHIGACVKLYHEMPSETITLETSGGATSGTTLCGDGWKVLTHGKWGGKVTIQTSTDGSAWHDYRCYTSKYENGNGDFNATESGTVDEYTYMRVVTAVTGGTCTIDLTRLPYTHEGHAQITAVNSGKSATATVIKQFGSANRTDIYSFSVWCPEFGFPKSICFFQDRLVLASNTLYPCTIWMSRTGDYYNFSTEKADGKVTDDSAIMMNLVCRQEFNIQHLVAFTDLIAFTDGNEWVISGSSTVTPSSCTSRVQSSRGCAGPVPLLIGGRMVYVQRRGKSVRDFAYNFDTDNYDGPDLTILAKHLTQDCQLVDDCFEQDPDSMLFFVRDDGKMNCLTYVADQKVYAWSELDTDGSYEACTNIISGTRDVVYVVVKRKVNGAEKRLIECFTDYPHTSEPMDYTMLDCAHYFESNTLTDTLTGVKVLAGNKVVVLADGKTYRDLTVASNGTVKVPGAFKKAIAGIPYTTELVQPNLEIAGTSGSQQGRFKKIDEAILKLTNTMGGQIGDSDEFMDGLVYDTDRLYTGDLKVTIPNQPMGGYEKYGRVYIRTDEPYPFDLSSIVRVVTFGG